MLKTGFIRSVCYDHAESVEGPDVTHAYPGGSNSVHDKTLVDKADDTDGTKVGSHPVCDKVRKALREYIVHILGENSLKVTVDKGPCIDAKLGHGLLPIPVLLKRMSLGGVRNLASVAPLGNHKYIPKHNVNDGSHHNNTNLDLTKDVDGNITVAINATTSHMGAIGFTDVLKYADRDSKGGSGAHALNGIHENTKRIKGDVLLFSKS